VARHKFLDTGIIAPGGPNLLLAGNRNYDLSVQNGTLVATFEDDPDREIPPLIITYKRNGETFEVASILKTGIFPTSCDCAKAASEMERVICHVPALAALDLRLSESYKTLSARLPRQERDKLKSEQRDWLRQRDRECQPSYLLARRAAQTWNAQRWQGNPPPDRGYKSPLFICCTAKSQARAVRAI
jgi:uncharacterized protein YecT (DUF1311 family)